MCTRHGSVPGLCRAPDTSHAIATRSGKALNGARSWRMSAGRCPVEIREHESLTGSKHRQGCRRGTYVRRIDLCRQHLAASEVQRRSPCSHTCGIHSLEVPGLIESTQCSRPIIRSGGSPLCGRARYERRHFTIPAESVRSHSRCIYLLDDKQKSSLHGPRLARQRLARRYTKVRNSDHWMALDASSLAVDGNTPLVNKEGVDAIANRARLRVPPIALSKFGRLPVQCEVTRAIRRLRGQA
jgi:hypothetical protein